MTSSKGFFLGETSLQTIQSLHLTSGKLDADFKTVAPACAPIVASSHLQEKTDHGKAIELKTAYAIEPVDPDVLVSLFFWRNMMQSPVPLDMLTSLIISPSTLVEKPRPRDKASLCPSFRRLSSDKSLWSEL